MYHNKEGALIRIEHAHKYTFFSVYCPEQKHSFPTHLTLGAQAFIQRGTYVHMYVKAVMWDIHD